GDGGAVGGQHDAALGVGTVEVVHVAPQRGAEAEVVLRPGPGGDGEGVGRVAGHAEGPFVERGADVLAGLAGQGQLEVVDGRGAVHDHGLDQAALDPVDEVGAAAGLDDVAADGGDDGAALDVGAGEVEAD